jgi:hypothetical protein
MTPGERAATGRSGSWLWIVLFAVGAFHLATMRDGFDWFHDSVGYVNHAENLAAGRDYAESGYIPNPYRYIAPKAYPPGYPFLLAPVVAAFGTDTRILRMETVVVLLAILLALGRTLRDQLPAGYLALLLAAVGVHPLIWENMQRLLSDVPFLLFVVLSLGTFGRARAATTARAKVLLGVLAGALVYYAVITRALGAVLLPAILLHDLMGFRFRRISPAAVAMIVTVGVLAFAGSRTPFARSLAEAGRMSDLPPNPYLAMQDAPQRPPDPAAPGETRRPEYRHSHTRLMLSNVLRHVELVPKRAARNVLQYARWGAELWDNGRAPVVGKAMFLLAAAVAAVGFVHRVRRRRRAYDVFAVLYFLALLPWSFAERRYLFPLLPFAWLALLTGVRVLVEGRGAARRWVVAGTAAVIALTYASKYAALDLGPIEDEYSGPDAAALYAFLDEETAPDDVFVGEYPRQLAYFTGHRVSAPHRDLDPRPWWPHIEWLGARYAIVGPEGWPGVAALAEFAETADGFHEVFHRGRFRVYRMDPPAAR